MAEVVRKRPSTESVEHVEDLLVDSGAANPGFDRRFNVPDRLHDPVGRGDLRFSRAAADHKGPAKIAAVPTIDHSKIINGCFAGYDGTVTRKTSERAALEVIAEFRQGLADSFHGCRIHLCIQCDLGDTWRQ